MSDWPYGLMQRKPRLSSFQSVDTVLITFAAAFLYLGHGIAVTFMIFSRIAWTLEASVYV